MLAPDRLVLTPTARLARDRSRTLAEQMSAAGSGAWFPPQVLSFSAWLTALRDDYLLSDDDPRVPISAGQALLIWQGLIDREVFVGEPRVAELAQRAWRLIHEHDLMAPQDWPALWLSEDSRRFRDWAARYREACSRRALIDDWAFAAEVPSLIVEGRISTPETIELDGFDLPLTPLQRNILDACAAAGTRISRRDAPPGDPEQPIILQYEEPDDELVGAARWARLQLEADPAQSIAIVVPDLGNRLAHVERSFRQVFDPPAFSLQATGPEPWHVSLGRPLAEWPLIADGLALLSLGDQGLTQPQATRPLRSPFLPGWVEEAPARERALAQLARWAPYELTWNEMRHELRAAGAGLLADRLEDWEAQRRAAPAAGWPSLWAAQFQQELSSVGFAGGRALDSREYQGLQRWHELLEAFSALDVVTETPLTRGQALAALAERAAGTVFRERNPGVPVEILGIEEALGSRFDALWLTTLDSTTWPGPTRREPLIPGPVQAAVPRATSEGCMARAEQELQLLLRAATVVRGSYARGNEDDPLALTVLLAHCPQTPAERPAPPEPAAMDHVRDDDRAPAFAATSAGGGTSVLRQQSDCPFRAFAQQRLGAVDLQPPRPGLDAGQRGTLVHRALEQFWNGLDGRAALLALDTEALSMRIQNAAVSALDRLTRRYRLTLSRAGRRLEQRRTERVLANWLAVERERGDFTVEGHEREITMTFSGLTLTGKIDRIDRLEDGSTVLIDYKTGRTSRGDWYPEPRIADPQLPAYAVTLRPPPAAIAFARLRPEDLRFDGLARHDVGMAGVTPLANARHRFAALADWNELMTGWRTQLDALAGDFIAGAAAVAPRTPAVCSFCHLQALCRVHERAPFADADVEAGGTASGDSGDG
ncbi:MAG: PD-(D/E)XK nuclease family protein [Pseudomonadales bacterium]